MPLGASLEVPEHEFEDADWEDGDDEELGTDDEEIDLDDFDDIDEEEDGEEI